MSRFLDREEIHAQFVSRMGSADRKRYHEFGDKSLVRVFPGKIFIVYNLLHQSSTPNILTNLRITSTNIVGDDVVISYLDLKTGIVWEATYVPELVCEYDVFVSVPSECMLMKVFKEVNGGEVIDGSLSAGLLFKHRMKPEFKRPGYIYCVGLSEFQRMFGNQAKEAFDKLEAGGD